MPDVLALRDGKLTPDDILLPGVIVSLRDGVTGLADLGSAALPGYYAADQPISTVTDSGGYYEFVGLPPGVYAVYEVRPDGYFPGIDTPGSTGGVVISPLVTTDPAILAALLDTADRRRAGQHSARTRPALDGQQLQRRDDGRSIRSFCRRSPASPIRSCRRASSRWRRRRFRSPSSQTPFLAAADSDAGRRRACTPGT